MQKSEITGDTRILNGGTKILLELDCILKASKRLEIVPVQIGEKNGFVLIGEHQLSVPYGAFSPVEVSLWLGANNTFPKHSEPNGFTPEKVRTQVQNILRSYRELCHHGSIPLGSDVVLGFKRNGRQTLALQVSSYP
ncbi:MAG: hypothetical protein ACFFB3_11980 [Candidatus Hodarchaeota archaeon]